MPLKNHGFLSPDAEGCRENFERVSSVLASGYLQLLEVHYRVLYSLKVPTSGGPLFTALLFLRALEFYQAAYVLVSRGMENSGRVVVRSLAETVFNLCAIVHHPGTLQQLANAAELERLKTINRAQQSTLKSMKDWSNGPEMQMIQSELSEIVNEQKIRRLTVEEVSRRGGMHSWYDTVYSFLSKTSHSQISDLERHVQFDARDVVAGIINGPEFGFSTMLLGASVEAMAHALEALGSAYDLDLSAETAEHFAFLRTIFDLPETQDDA